MWRTPLGSFYSDTFFEFFVVVKHFAKKTEFKPPVRMSCVTPKAMLCLKAYIPNVLLLFLLKMPSTKYLRCLIYPLKNAFTSSSNIPLVTFISKLCLYPRQFPLFPNKSGTFIPSRPGWRTKFFKYFAQLGILLHLLGCLNWFKIQWFDHKQCGVVTPTWKFMLVTCSMIIFAAESLSFPHIDQVKMHLVTLLNSAMSVEIKLQRGGNKIKYVYINICVN